MLTVVSRFASWTLTSSAGVVQTTISFAPNSVPKMLRNRHFRSARGEKPTLDQSSIKVRNPGEWEFAGASPSHWAGTLTTRPTNSYRRTRIQPVNAATCPRQKDPNRLRVRSGSLARHRAPSGATARLGRRSRWSLRHNNIRSHRGVTIASIAPVIARVVQCRPIRRADAAHPTTRSSPCALAYRWFSCATVWPRCEPGPGKLASKLRRQGIQYNFGYILYIFGYISM